MLRSLFKLTGIVEQSGENRSHLPQITSMPKDLRIYAIGDIHGMSKHAAEMFAEIDRDVASTRDGGRAIVVSLGDYLDRGPNSREVIDLLAMRSRLHGDNFIALRGNHEDVFLRFLEKPEAAGPLWLELGAAATLNSYGVKLPAGRADFKQIREDLSSRLPLEHLIFLQSLRFSFSLYDYFFSHAGARPGIPLLKQTEADLLWGRSSKYEKDVQFEKMIVHGHTPVNQPEMNRSTINIDTGAYATGRLTALKIEPKGISLIEVDSAGSHQSIEYSALPK